MAFGEGLQLVNILKDSTDDNVEGRNYLPYDIERREVFDLARQDLEAATEYTLAIQQAGGPEGLVLFTGLPVAPGLGDSRQGGERGAWSEDRPRGSLRHQQPPEEGGGGWPTGNPIPGDQEIGLMGRYLRRFLSFLILQVLLVTVAECPDSGPARPRCGVS